MMSVGSGLATSPIGSVFSPNYRLGSTYSTRLDLGGTGFQPVGKQRWLRGGIYYSEHSGIWQVSSVAAASYSRQTRPGAHGSGSAGSHSEPKPG